MRVPDFREPGLSEFLRKMDTDIQRRVDDRMPARTAVASVLLQSPNGSVYAISVDDAGDLVTTLVAGVA